MASSTFRLLRRSMAVRGASCIKGSSSSLPYAVAYLLKMSASGFPCLADERLVQSYGYANAAAYHGNGSEEIERRGGRKVGYEEEEEVPTEGISRPMSQILKQLNKKVPDSLISVRSEDGFSVKYIPWHIVNRIMNLHAPEWSGEVRSITYSPDGKSAFVVYRVTLHGTDAEIYRESTGTASVDDKGFGDAVQKAEAMAFRRACSRLGLGLHLYHEDMS